MSDATNTELEIKIAFFERHAEEQDKAILALSKEVDALRREIKDLRERAQPSSGESGPPADERPPHY